MLPIPKNTGHKKPRDYKNAYDSYLIAHSFTWNKKANEEKIQLKEIKQAKTVDYWTYKAT